MVAVYAVVGAWWLLVTDRASMWLFFTDHPSYSDLLSTKNLLYLVRLWLFGYSAHWLIGLAALLLAVVAARA